jgi:hypothetical protein
MSVRVETLAAGSDLKAYDDALLGAGLALAATIAAKRNPRFTGTRAGT